MKLNNLLAFVFASLLTASVIAEDNRLNVLFIAIDDLRPELGCYGNTVVQSPNIDKLASEGMRFDRAYCQVAVCGASRASMMTGILPTSTRFTNYLTRADEDTPNAATMPQVFKEAGYTTLVNGKIFHTSSDTAKRSWSRPMLSPRFSHKHNLSPATAKVLSKQGNGLFYECVEAEDNEYRDGIVAEQTISDLRELKQNGKPFFLACGFIRPHLPFYAPKKYWDIYDEANLSVARNQHRPKHAPKSLRGSKEYTSYVLADYEVDSEAFHRKMLHGYYAATSYADQLTGNVLDELDRLGLADNTMVILWGDHGWHLGEHNFWGKHNTLHNALRVPLIVKVPGKKPGSSDSLVPSVDLFPTICTLAGLDLPSSVQGISFEALLDNPAAIIHDHVYSRFKNADAVVTKNFTYSLFENGEEMLYDLAKDPQENRNVANQRKYAKTLQTMRNALEERIKLAEAATY